MRQLLPKNRLARNISILTGGTAAGQATVVLASPLLTRLYSPEDFGLLAIYASLLAITSVVASLRYQMAIPLPESDEQAVQVVVLSLLVVLGTSVLTALAVVFFNGLIAHAMHLPALARYLWLLPIGLLFVGTYQAFNYWAIRMKAFHAVAQTKLIQSVGMVSVQIGAYALGPVALLLGQVAGQAAGSTSLAILAIRKRLPVYQAVNISGVIQAARRYKRFPLFSTWGGVFNAVGSQLPPVLLALLFSSAAAGLYVLAHRVLAMPMKLIGRAIADAFFSNAADARRDGTLASLVATIYDKLTHIAMPLSLMLMLAGPELFARVFGSDWKMAGEFAQWMAPWIYIVFVTSPLSALPEVLEKQAHGLLFQGLLLVVRAAALIAGSIYGGLKFAIALFASGSAVCWLVFLVWIFYASGNSWRNLISSFLRSFAESILLVIPLIIWRTFGEGPDSLFSAIAMSIGLVFMRYCYLIKKAW
jgi:O-antigen/teichoic acid export membrane protein